MKMKFDEISWMEEAGGLIRIFGAHEAFLLQVCCGIFVNN